MKRTWSIGVATGLLLLAGFALRAEEAKPAADGWISLFNGKDLTGWKASEEGDFKVEDGVIVVRGKRAHLFTEQQFKNFEFETEVMTEPGSNSGIYFHTGYEETWPNQGYECQVNVTHGDPVKTGSIYNVVKLYKTPAVDGKWWKQSITVKGKNIVVKINDEVVLDFTEPEGVTGTRKLGKGSFAFQAHDPKSVVRYRNVRVKPLAD